MRTIPSIGEDLKRIDEILTSKLIPAITRGIQPNDTERRLFSLPPSLGGLGIPIFSELADREFSNSTILTEQLQKNILSQEPPNNINKEAIKKIKAKIKRDKIELYQQHLNAIKDSLPEDKIKLIEISCEKGASLWLSTLPIKEEGFQIDKQSFWDLIKIRYGHQLTRLRNECACGSKFDLEHSLSCKKGGFVTIRHKSIRDLTAKMLTEVCKDVSVEPHLHPITGETLGEATANTSDKARLDIAARGFWVSGKKAFFDIRVFNPVAGRYRNSKIPKACELNEKEKKRQYNQWVLNIEHGSFTLLVFTAMGGMGRESKLFYKRHSELLADPRSDHISITTTWVRRKVIFALMRSVVLCLRGSRISWNKDLLPSSISNSASVCESICSFSN